MFPMPGLPEMIVFGIIALLLFGKRLPEVARSLGKGIVEFKKGIRGIDDEVNASTYNQNTSTHTSHSSRPAPPDEPVEAIAPKFEPPKTEPR